MKLLGLEIEDFQQFKNFRLEFTDRAGMPLEKVCFIGPNGTGKSTLLRRLYAATDPELGIRFLESGNCKLTCPKKDFPVPGPFPALISWQAQPSEVPHFLESPRTIGELLTILCPADGDGGKPLNFNLPLTNLNEALVQHTTPHNRPIVGLAEASRFWNELIFLLHERRKKLEEFQRAPENRTKTIEQIDALFNPGHPEALPALAQVWNKILNLAGLEFDLASASIPFQLTDNLEVFVHTKSGQKRIPYGAMSTGIIHYLFRLGHIWSLYFNRPPGDSILLVDEPEGSLYPDFLYDIVENYCEVAPGCQLFMATHSPIVAAQFKPEERFILSFADEGYVTAHRGISPEGDDPNDLLDKDFGVRSLMPAAGQRKWEEFLELRRRITAAAPQDRLPLVEKCAKIGYDYNFPLNGA